jgi:hypothetical protein
METWARARGPVAVALLIVMMLFGATPVQAARGGGGGSGSHGGSSQGGGHGSGNWHHNGSFHHRGTFFVGVSPWWWGGYWNAPYWYYPYPYYPYPYNYPSGYPPTGAYGSGEGVTYIEQSPAPASPPTAYWYYCDSPAGYYPSIAQCAQWILVDPRAPR